MNPAAGIEIDGNQKDLATHHFFARTTIRTPASLLWSNDFDEVPIATQHLIVLWMRRRTRNRLNLLNAIGYGPTILIGRSPRGLRMGPP